MVNNKEDCFQNKKLLIFFKNILSLLDAFKLALECQQNWHYELYISITVLLKFTIMIWGLRMVGNFKHH